MTDFTSAMVQFSFSNPNLVPESAKKLADETIGDMKQRVAAGNGICLLQPTSQTDVANLKADLIAAGYTLVSGSTQQRLKKDGTPYWTVRFVFVPSDRAHTSEEFDSAAVVAALDEITRMSFWRARGFDNPADDGERMLSINLEARVQRYIKEDPEQPVLVRQRDESGRPCGDPFPIKPTATLAFTSEGLILK